jgi:hypothetical protein
MVADLASEKREARLATAGCRRLTDKMRGLKDSESKVHIRFRHKFSERRHAGL